MSLNRWEALGWDASGHENAGSESIVSSERTKRFFFVILRRREVNYEC